MRQRIEWGGPSGMPSMQYQLLNVAALRLRVTGGVSGIPPERTLGPVAYTAPKVLRLCVLINKGGRNSLFCLIDGDEPPHSPIIANALNHANKLFASC